MDLLIYRATATLRRESPGVQQMCISSYVDVKTKGVNLSHPLAEADDRPQTEAQSTAAAEAATEEPPHIDWQCLSQAAVHAADTGFEFFWCHLRKRTFKMKVMR